MHHTATIKKRISKLAAVLCALVVVVIVCRSFSKPDDPVYDGKPLSAWLDDMPSIGGANRGPIYNALRQIGPDAVPMIFSKLKQNDSAWANWYRDEWPKFPGFLRNHLKQPQRIELSFNSWNAELALRLCCGTNLNRKVINRLNDGNPAVREAAWAAFTGFEGGQLSANETISLCVPALRDDDAVVRSSAATILGQLGASASNAVPDLIQALSGDEKGRWPGERVFVAANVATALGKIGPLASNAVPALTNLMASTNGLNRVGAALAVWQITSDDALALPVLARELPRMDLAGKMTIVTIIQGMGPRARPALPMLLNEYAASTNNTETGMLGRALKAIDPETAASKGIK